uniref:FYVE-type domain-containing protein n=1 Tax=Globisporangium ultimum (strain ATCC 200006 / CBS 805.95 / DAOM BR144) TaxID=431595 RepID=K3WI51_GLOUD
MKFPLPANTFPTLELPAADIAKIEALSSLLVEKTLGQYQEHQDARGGVVDLQRWKKVKQRQDIKVYKERVSTPSRIGDGDYDEAAAPYRQTDGVHYGDTVPVLMGVGTLIGSLDDVMYGVLNPTTESMRIKSVYTEDGFLDGTVLATLIAPSVVDPLRSLTLRWLLKRNPLIMTAVVRLRDVVYFESTGIALTKTGERIGYQLLHSVELPGVRELVDEYQIVRANVSFCYLYRQKTPEVVDVFMRGMLNPLGDVHPAVCVIATAEALVAVERNVYCAQMKKLMWQLRRAKQPVQPVIVADATQCRICEQQLSSSSFTLKKGARKRCCAVCLEQICSNCCETHRLNFMSSQRHNAVAQNKLSFCVRWVQQAIATSAFEVAVDEVGEIRATFDDIFFLGGRTDSEVGTSSLSSSITSERSFFV